MLIKTTSPLEKGHFLFALSILKKKTLYADSSPDPT